MKSQTAGSFHPVPAAEPGADTLPTPEATAPVPLDGLFRTMIGGLPDAVFLIDDQGSFKYVCANATALFGHTPTELMSLRTIDDLLGPQAFNPAALAELSSAYRFERAVAARSGEARTIDVQFQRLSIDSGTILCTCRDVTDLRRLEGELASSHLNLTHAARLAQTGQLLHSILHEIRHPLLAIKLAAASGRHLLEADDTAIVGPALRELFDTVRTAADIATGVVDRVNNRSERKAFELAPTDIGTAIREALDLVQAEASGRRVMIRPELAQALPVVMADRVAVQQLVLDLVMNGIDAAEARQGGAQVNVRTWKTPESVEIAVSDNGRGVPKEHADRLFDAYFTTKPTGVGLGLAIAQAIVTAHNGRIWLDREAAVGATFRVSLPADRSLRDRAGSTGKRRK